MDVFGIGPMEFVYIVLILLVIFGPNDLVKGARSIGSLVNQWRRSDDFQLIKQVAKEVRDLPNRLTEEAALDDAEKLINETKKEVKASVAAPKHDNPQKVLSEQEAAL